MNPLQFGMSLLSHFICVKLHLVLLAGELRCQNSKNKLLVTIVAQPTTVSPDKQTKGTLFSNAESGGEDRSSLIWESRM